MKVATFSRPMRKTPILLALVFTACAGYKPSAWDVAAVRQQHPWGYYSGQVEARWENDGRHMTLLSELRYTDPEGVIWTAPGGSVVDGASIPRALWSLMGGPFDGKYRNASVLHDVAYDRKARPWKQCDRMFYNAMRCSGVSATEAKTMYYALYRHGRHWRRTLLSPESGIAADEVVPRAIAVTEQEEVAAARDWIENAKPSLAQIEARAAGAQ
jgi:Protein of unknown function (DUF1353)